MYDGSDELVMDEVSELVPALLFISIGLVG
jgi:hypothetical protein